MPGGAHAGAAEEGLDVGPVGELVADALVAFGIGLFEPAQGLVGEDHAPPERVVDAVAFVEGDLGSGQVLFSEQCRVETGRAAADAGDFHG